MTDIKTLWTKQRTEETVTLENIHDRAARYQRRIRLANTIEYVASIFVAIIFSWYIWIFPGWMAKTGSALVILGAAYAMWQMRKRGGARKVPDDSALGLVEFHRQALERRRDLQRSAWSWYILPVLPGVVLLLLSRWYQVHVPWRTLVWDHEVIVGTGAIVFLYFGYAIYRQRRRARELQQEIDDLDRLTS